MEESPEVLILLLVLGFALVSALRRSPGGKGRAGERKVRRITGSRLDSKAYQSFHDLTLPTPDGTTQVDHVIVSKFGVFVIETKNMTGWIFGDVNARRWTQSIYGKTYPFQNPLNQNYKHVKAVQSLLGLQSRCFHSLVVFVGDSEFKTPMPPNVMGRRELLPYIRSRSEVLLSEREVEASIRTLTGAQTSGFWARRRHIENLEKNRRNPACPRCGKAMVLRVAKKGRRVGGRFWGCPDFPRCRATREVA